MSGGVKNKFIDILFNNGKILFLGFLFLVIFGGISLSQMKKQGFPDVNVNIVSVNVLYPNASETQVEKEILIPLESVLKEIEDVEEFQTIAGNSFGTAVVTFDAKANVDDVITELNSKMSSIKLPEGAKAPVVNKFSVSGTGEFMLAVSGYNNEWDLYNKGNSLESKLLGLGGVKEVTAQNELTPQVVISFDNNKLKEYGLSRKQVEDVIRTAEFKAPVGSYTENQQSISIILEKSISTLDDIKNLVLTEGVVLEDVSTIKTILNNNNHYNRIGFREDGQEDLFIERALVYGVKLEKGADILEVDDSIKELLVKLNEEESGEYIMLFNQADATRLQIKEITQSIFGGNIDSWGKLGFIGYMFGGLVFVVLLLLLFMNLRVAVLAALSIPLSLFSSVIYLNLVGIELNTLVLFSMVLTIGLVIDPSIVFLESLQRFKDQGMSGKEAATKTWNTVGSGVFLAVATNAIVFIPFSIVSGFFGEIIKYIPATVIPAMIASMVVPVIFFTAFAAKIFKRHTFAHNSGINDEMIGIWKLGQWIGKSIKWFLGKTKARFVLRILLFLAIISLPIISGVVLTKTGAFEIVQFSATEDAELLLVEGDITNEWSFEKSVYEVAVPVQDLLKGIPEIKNFSFYQQNGNSFTMLIQLYPIDERVEKDMRTSDQVAEFINNSIKDLNIDATIKASTNGEGPPQDSFPIRVRLLGNDTDVLVNAAEDIKTFLQNKEGVDRVDDNVSEGSAGGTITFVLDQNNKNAQNPFLIYSSINERLAENDLGKIDLNGENYEIVSNIISIVSSEQDVLNIIVPTTEQMVYEQTLAQMKTQGIKNPESILKKPEVVTVSDIISEKENKESITIQRINGERYVEVYASVKDGVDSAKVQTALEDYLTKEKLEELGLNEDALDYEGTADSIAQSFTDLLVALVIAIFLIYVLLVGFFRSFLQPFIILVAIPLGLFGVFFAIWLTTGQLGFLELLGVVTMAGIVVNVTILLIDYANQLKKEGKNTADAISTAVAVRFRPIILTQLTAFGSLAPLVFLSPFWKGLAASIIFGILSSAILSLFMTPILYQWVESTNSGSKRFFKRISNKFKRNK